MQTPSVNPTRAGVCTEHQICELHGFVLSDSTHGSINNSVPERELIWVGIYGEGRWLKPEEVLQLAAALEHMANAHIERIANSHLAQLGKGGAA